MSEFVNLGYYAPRPTYFVTLAGTLSFEPTEIPQFHQRPGDLERNRLVKVVLQCTGASTAAVIGIIDEDNVEGLKVSHFLNGLPPLEIITDSRLRLVQSASGSATPDYVCMAFYEKPLTR